MSRTGVRLGRRNAGLLASLLALVFVAVLLSAPPAHAQTSAPSILPTPRALQEYDRPDVFPNLGTLKAQPAPPATRTAQPEIAVMGTDKADVIRIHQNQDGSLAIIVNGHKTTYSAQDAANLVILGLGGDDSIAADSSVTLDLHLDGGPGNDVIHGGAGDDRILGGDGNDFIFCEDGNDLADGGAGIDVIYGGAGEDGLAGGDGNDLVYGGDGRDYLEGGRGDDYLDGGAGDDVLYGLDGRDILHGGSGNDYLDGGAGNDLLCGDGGNDILFGGTGDDALVGGTGTDLLAGRHGVDSYLAGATSRVYAQSDDHLLQGSLELRTLVDLSGTNDAGGELGSSIAIVGDPDFQMRVASDLEALRSIPIGRSMLGCLDNSGEAFSDSQTSSPNFILFDDWSNSFLFPDGSHGTGGGSSINYNPYRVTLYDGSESWERRPPIVGEYHEMVHALNGATGTLQPGYTSTWVPNLEMQCLGLPFDGILFRWDTNPDTPLSQYNPVTYTENGLRAFFGIPLRPRY